MHTILIPLFFLIIQLILPINPQNILCTLAEVKINHEEIDKWSIKEKEGGDSMNRLSDSTNIEKYWIC